jgi:hypothetical protein
MRPSNLMNAAIGMAGVTGACLLALPAQAAPAVQYPAACQAMHPNANCLNRGPGNPGRYYGYVSPGAYNYGGPGYPTYSAYEFAFTPVFVAADLAGAAVGTVLAPNPIAWDGEYYDGRR